MDVFSAEESIDKGDPFVEMRVKKNLIVPNRAFEKSPNGMRVKLSSACGKLQ